MKTIDDLKALLPTLIELFAQEDREIGESYWEQDEDGGTNCTKCFNYEEDGWSIEVHYECCGEFSYDPGDYWTPPCYDLIRAWGEVSEINVSHYDEASGDETEFSVDELEEFFAPFNEQLKNIA